MTHNNPVVPHHPCAVSPSGESGAVPIWLQPSLTAWRMSDPVPLDIIPHLPSAMAQAEQALQPIAPKALAVLLDHLFTTLPAPDRDGLRLWRHMLSPYPEQVLARAVREVIATHRWESVPKIAQVLDACKEDLLRLHGWKRKLETVAMKVRMEQRTITPILPRLGEPASHEASATPNRVQQALQHSQQALRRKSSQAFFLPTESRP